MTAFAPHPPSPGRLDRVRVATAAGAAAVLGAAPHVLHHVGPLAGAALLSGAGGTLLLGALGLLAAVPMLLRLRRRTGGWTAPAAAFTVFAVLFALSSTVIAPAVTGSNSGSTSSPASTQQPAAPTPSEHEQHHR